MFRKQAAIHITQVIGGVHLYVRTGARADVPPSPYLGNGWTDCAEIWCVVTVFANVHGGAQLHVRTFAPLFRILEVVGRIALKFGM